MSRLVAAILVIGCVLFSGCSTGPRYSSHSIVEPGYGALYLFREGKFVGAGNSAYITVNKRMYTLKNGTYEFIELPAGKYLLHLDSAAAAADITVDVEVGRNTYVKYEPSIDFFSSGLKHNIAFKKLEESDARKILLPLRLSATKVKPAGI